jgi:DNA-binding NarL/FixJ family response regulator
MSRKAQRQEGRSLADAKLGDELVVKLSSLRRAKSPRLVREDLEHAQALAEVEARLLPPVVVLAGAMAVVDGWHLVLAARIRGEKEIRARMLEASEEEAYLIAVHTNATHGKPLTLAERLRASSHLLENRPELSDQAIAGVCALASQTVANQRNAQALPSLTPGPGPKSRKRRLSTRVAREEAAGRMSVFPDDSNRKIAREVGVSEKTVRDVRRRVKGGDSPSL